MIEFYANASPNVAKIFIALEEMALPYTARLVQTMKGEQLQPGFTKMSPLGKIPLIVDSDAIGGRSHKVFESAAILLYLGEKTGRFVPEDPLAKSEVLQWVILQVANVGPMFGQYVHFSRFAPEGSDNTYAKDRYRTQVRRILESVEHRLGEAQFIGGATYTVADMSWYPWLRAIDFVLGVGADKDYAHIRRWRDEVGARPAVPKALAKMDAVGANAVKLADAPTEARDRFFGRGAYARQ
jgi:GST-like protein